VYDLAVTEVLARMASRGDLSIDAGAHIVQMRHRDQGWQTGE